MSVLMLALRPLLPQTHRPDVLCRRSGVLATVPPARAPAVCSTSMVMAGSLCSRAREVCWATRRNGTRTPPSHVEPFPSRRSPPSGLFAVSQPGAVVQATDTGFRSDGASSRALRPAPPTSISHEDFAVRRVFEFAPMAVETCEGTWGICVRQYRRGPVLFFFDETDRAFGVRWSVFRWFGGLVFRRSPPPGSRQGRDLTLSPG